MQQDSKELKRQNDILIDCLVDCSAKKMQLEREVECKLTTISDLLNKLEKQQILNNELRHQLEEFESLSWFVDINLFKFEICFRPSPR